ncbi:hypothetical protein ACJMK2_029676 [Sinanodonta woodiana]|uniref:Dynamin N-terminal domain-containing protein n=1 Tax=Sinanodonta woodiana TaxID=1069815 RepID=A0ABD3XAX2_SINWO
MLELCSSLIATVKNESFMTNMSEVTNTRFPDYETELDSINKILQNMTEEFEVVVTGETSSGKSTFLNVLIGDRILPSHHLHTTASLCRIHNSETKIIECIVNGITVENISMKADSSELKRELESITKKLLSEDGDEEPLKVIDIYWPISSLHDNIVLIDTPGIGERDALTKQVVEFVPKCAGYIFVVDSSRAGGVRDSGLRKLLGEIAESDSKEDDKDDFSNAIFVCNKWDLVPKQEREAVLEDTKRKISKYCGQVKDWQIVQFNAELDLKLQEWKANPTDNFKTLLESLDTLMIRAIEKRLRDEHRCLQNFVMAVNGLVTVRINAAELSKELVELEMEIARTNLDTIVKELEKCSELEVMLDQEDNALLQDLEKYLKSEETQIRYFDWTSSVPDMFELADIGPSLIKERIQDAIWDWSTVDNGPFQQASVRIADNCTKLQSNIDSMIGKLNNLELGFSFIKHSGQVGSPSSDEIGIISNMGITIGSASSPIWMKVARVFHTIRRIRVIDRVEKGKKKVIEQMRNSTLKAIDTLVSENRLKTFITDSFTNHYSKWLTALREDAVRITSSTRAWLICIERDLYKDIDTLQMFKKLQAMLNECSDRLHELENDI